MNKDYMIEKERNAYNRGCIAHINGLTEQDNPFSPLSKPLHRELSLYRYWLAGFNEKGSIKK